MGNGSNWGPVKTQNVYFFNAGQNRLGWVDPETILLSLVLNFVNDYFLLFVNKIIWKVVCFRYILVSFDLFHL